MYHTCVQRLSSIWELLFPTKKMINSGFFYGKKSMSPLTADDVFKNSTPKSSSQKKMFTVFLSKKVFSMNLFFVCTPSNDIWREKSSQNINYSGALRTPKCVSPDSWKFWDIHNEVEYILILNRMGDWDRVRRPLIRIYDEMMFKCDLKTVLGPLRYTSQLYRA